MRTHENTREAYASILMSLPHSRAAVMEVIARRGPITSNDIADYLEIPINRVTGRVRELLDGNLVQECGTVRTGTDRPRALLNAVRPEPEQGKLAL